jgi:superfamily I DNA/RNA helicase
MDTFMPKAKELNGDSAILCRNTAPLLTLAFKLISQKIGCKVEGRDIGASLKKIANRWKVKNTEELIYKLEAFVETEKTKHLAKKNEMKAQAVADQVEALRVVIDHVNAEGKHSVADVCKAIDDMFSDDVNKKGLLTLSTIHKSKGREWKNVYWLNRETTCPSKYARQDWQIEQEANLCYVAATRSKWALIDLTMEK